MCFILKGQLSITEAKLKANRTNILVGSDPTECLQLCTRLPNRRRSFSFTLLLNRSHTYVQFQYKHLLFTSRLSAEVGSTQSHMSDMSLCV